MNTAGQCASWLWVAVGEQTCARIQKFVATAGKHAGSRYIDGHGTQFESTGYMNKAIVFFIRLLAIGDAIEDAKVSETSPTQAYKVALTSLQRSHEGSGRPQPLSNSTET